MSKSTKSTAKSVYTTEAAAKGRAAKMAKANPLQTFTVEHNDEGFYVAISAKPVVINTIEPMVKAEVVEAVAAAFVPIEAGVKEAKPAFRWLPKVLEQVRAKGASSETIKLDTTGKRIRLMVNGKTATWFTKQVYADAVVQGL